MEGWTGTARSAWFVVLAGCDLVIAVAITGAGHPAAGALMLAVVAAFALFVEVRVIVDDDGLHVRTGPLAWPSVTIPIEEIEAATAIDVRPWRWGGWGYRGSLRLFSRAAWVVRAGPGVRLDLTRGRRFVVTVDDADAGAAAISARLRRPG